LSADPYRFSTDNKSGDSMNASMYSELVLRVGDPDRDVTYLIEHAVRTFLDRTEDDEWSEVYTIWKESQKPADDVRQRVGDPTKGVHWTPLFLPNGTKISMPYGGTTHDAEIRHEKIFLGDEEIASPSLLASRIAGGTSRNAWRDLRIKRPTDIEYRLADDLRREGARK
jgi:hypothetical protein